jgi:glycogen operon protein
MPKAVVVDESFNWGDDRPPHRGRRPSIYEAHVRGASMLRETCCRSSAAPLPRWPIRASSTTCTLGVTTIELLPVHAFLQDRFLIERGLRNYWGYNTLAFFAPEPLYLSGRQHHEVKIAIRRLHAAGIEYARRGLQPHLRRQRAGAHAVVARPGQRQLLPADAGRRAPLHQRHRLRQHAEPVASARAADGDGFAALLGEVFHVDGFRFDLGSTLGREPTASIPIRGSSTRAAGPGAVAREADLRALGLGPGGYQVGNHPPGFAEWNDKFRDNVRRFWRGDAGQRGELAAADRLRRPVRPPPSQAVGQHQLHHRARRLHAGRSGQLRHKHNEANGEDNRDGNDDNASANWSPDGSVEGPTDDEAS